MGFLTGHELTWMLEALRILRDELPNINVMISSQCSPPLADAISKGNVDAGFLRRVVGAHRYKPGKFQLAGRRVHL
jgi:LysR family transcriptional regulator, hca operon transcriptional activator